MSTRYLQIEDNENDLLLLTRVFGRVAPQSRILGVANAEAAVEWLTGRGHYADRQKFPLPDVILLDLKLPRMSGLEFLEWLRRAAPMPLRVVPVLVLTGTGAPQEVMNAFALGANSYFVKPGQWEDLCEQIRALTDYWSTHATKPYWVHGAPPRLPHPLSERRRGIPAARRTCFRRKKKMEQKSCNMVSYCIILMAAEWGNLRRRGTPWRTGGGVL